LVIDGDNDIYESFISAFKVETHPWAVILSDGQPVIGEQPTAETLNKLRAFQEVQGALDEVTGE